MSWGHQGTIIIITIIILVERQIHGRLLSLLTSSVIDTCLCIDHTGLQAFLARMTIMRIPSSSDKIGLRPPALQELFVPQVFQTHPSASMTTGSMAWILLDVREASCLERSPLSFLNNIIASVDQSGGFGFSAMGGPRWSGTFAHRWWSRRRSFLATRASNRSWCSTSCSSRTNSS